MRKLLLAGAAFVGSVGIASAQTATMPMAPTQGGISQYNTLLAGNNINNSDGSTPAPGPNVPTPGSVVIHIDGRVNVYASMEGGSGNVFAGSKTQAQQFLGYFRLYPGMDGMATNGMRYGGIVEIRQNFAGVSLGSGSATATNGTSFGASASGNSCASTLYVRREAAYVGSNSVGIFRFGQDDGPFSQLDGGVTTFQNFNDGAWNGDLPQAIPANAQPTWPFFSGIGKEYTQSKAVYFTPTFFGFDGAVSYAPSVATSNDAACNVAGTGCSNLATSTTAGDAGRPKDIVEVMGRYRGTVGPVGIYGIAGYTASGHVDSSVSATQPFKGLSVGDVGLAFTFAGVQVGGNVLFGNYNGQYSLEPTGGKSAVAWLAGATYTIGPVLMGVSYYNFQSQGSAAMVGKSQRYDDGLAVGGTYSVAPGMVVYLSYLYGQAHQGGVNILSGATGTTAGNDVHGQAFSLGTRMFW